MPTISQRGIDMPASPIRKLVPLANRAKAKGTVVYHLNIGQPDLATPEVALRAAHHLDREVLEYSPSEGILSFRKKLVEYYHKFTIDEGFALPSVEKFEALITPRTKAILICNPNNPTGYLYTRKEMNQIRDLVRKYDLFLFSDEVYREFCYTGAPYISAFHLEGIENNVILVDSVSKRYSECGIRIGALITKNKQVRENVMKWCQARLSPPLIGQIMAEASLDTPEEYMRDVYDEYVERRKFLIDGLNRIPGCYSPIPMGAFYTVARLPIDDADKFCAWCLEEFDYEGQTIFMAPASGFYTTPGLGKNEVRLAYVLKKEDLAKALVVLEKALETYNKKGKK